MADELRVRHAAGIVTAVTFQLSSFFASSYVLYLCLDSQTVTV